MTYLRENDPACHLIYYLSKCFPYEFMVSIASFKSSLFQQYFLNYGAIYNKIGNKAWYTLGHAYLVSYWSLPKCYLCSKYCKKYGHHNMMKAPRDS